MSSEISGLRPGIVFLGWYVCRSATSILSKTSAALDYSQLNGNYYFITALYLYIKIRN